MAATALSAVSQLMGLQLFSRALTFSLNQALIRVASPEVYGTATIQCELLLSTILFLSREGVRNALLRSENPSSSAKSGVEQPQDSTLVTNVSIIPILLGAPLAICGTLGYRHLASPSTRTQLHFDMAIFLYAVGAFLELLSEPLYTRALRQLHVHVRVRAEATGVVAKAVISLSLLLLLNDEWNLVAFAAGQVAYGAAVLAVCVAEYGRSSRVWIKPVKKNSHGNTRVTYFDKNLLKLSTIMTTQSIFKHFLTEGDRFLVSKFSPLEDQGGYAIATNYGSLVARIVFQPVEETSRLFFSKLLSNSVGKEASEHRESSTKASQILQSILFLYGHLAIIFLALGPPYIPTLLSVILPSRYLATSAPRVLKVYCAYLPIMAVNGVLEAFFTSTAREADLKKQGKYMIACTAVFVGAAAILVRASAGATGGGETGLVWANCLNLGMRAVYGWRFMLNYFNDSAATTPSDIGTVPQSSAKLIERTSFNWRACLPTTPVLFFGSIMAIVVRVSEWRYNTSHREVQDKIQHITLGLVCLMNWGIVCWISERQRLKNLSGIFGT